MTRLRRRYDADPAASHRASCEVRPLSVRTWYDQIARGWFQPALQLLCAALVFSLGSNLSRAPCPPHHPAIRKCKPLLARSAQPNRAQAEQVPIRNPYIAPSDSIKRSASPRENHIFRRCPMRQRNARCNQSHSLGVMVYNYITRGRANFVNAATLRGDRFFPGKSCNGVPLSPDVSFCWAAPESRIHVRIHSRAVAPLP